jgi:multidrug efflux system membrane fusion protein
MKFGPVITAVLVTVFLYFLVLDRDKLLEFAGVSASTESSEVATTAAEAGAPLVKVVVTRSEARILDNAVILRGETEAARQVDVRAETSGLVISEPLRKGAAVSEGDLLCELDAGTRRAALDEAKARLAEAISRMPEAEARAPEAEARMAEANSRVAEAEARLIEATARLSEAELNQNAATKLSEGGFASDSRVANAEATLESARAGVTSAQAAVNGARAGVVGAGAGLQSAASAVESVRAAIAGAEAAVASAERELSKLRIAAPFAGILETDAAEIGSLLQPGGACATVIQLDPIKLVGFVPEIDVAKIEPGARAGARLASGETILGNVTFIARSADPMTRTFRVEVEVANTDLAIRDGQTVEIMVAAEGRPAHLLPQSSLTLDDDGRIGVRLLGEGNVAQFAPVEILRDTIEGVWVSGLADAVNVITIGQEYVVDGVTVDPTFREAKG